MARASRRERAIELDVRAQVLLEELREQTEVIRRRNRRAAEIACEEKERDHGR